MVIFEILFHFNLIGAIIQQLRPLRTDCMQHLHPLKLASQPKQLRLRASTLMSKDSKIQLQSLTIKDVIPPPTTTTPLLFLSPRRPCYKHIPPLRSFSVEAIPFHAIVRPHSSNPPIHLGCCPAANRFLIPTPVDNIARYGAHSQRDRLSRPRRRQRWPGLRPHGQLQVWRQGHGH